MEGRVDAKIRVVRVLTNRGKQQNPLWQVVQGKRTY